MKKLNATMIIGLVVAVIGAAIVILYGRSVSAKVASGKETVPVVVATQNIPAGTTASALGDVTRVKKMPQAYVADGALTSLRAAPQGGSLLGPVTKGAQLAEADFGSAGQVGSGSVTPAKGTVALAVQVGLTPGVARYIGPGSTVDMFLTYGEGKAPQTKLFASTVKVLSVSVATPKQPADGQQSQPAASVGGDNVLAVVQADPQLAQRIVAATQTGKIYLALDAANDTEHDTPSAVTPAQILGATS
jgi:pilus assembly protein CpaB